MVSQGLLIDWPVSRLKHIAFTGVGPWIGIDSVGSRLFPRHR